MDTDIHQMLDSLAAPMETGIMMNMCANTLFTQPVTVSVAVRIWHAMPDTGVLRVGMRLRSLFQP